MAWIEFHAARIKRLKKFQDFRKSMSWSTIEALGFLGSFWGEVIELAEDGDITGWTPEYVAELTGLKISPERVWEALASNGWIDHRGENVIVHDWLDSAATYLRSKYAKDRREILVDIWALHGKSYGNPIGKPLDTACTLPNQTLPTNQKTNTGAKAQPIKRFTRPSAPEVTAYAKSISFALDGQHFVDYYDSKGWVVGRSPMRDWKAAVRTWKKNGFHAPAASAPPGKKYVEDRPLEEDIYVPPDKNADAELERQKNLMS